MTERRDSLSAAEESVAAPALTGTPPRSEERARADRRSSPHAGKFVAVTAALIGFALGALGVAAGLLATTSRHGSGPKWSAWSPSDGGLAGEREIANTVAPFYRAAPAAQLDIVTVHNVSSATSTSTSSSTTSSSGTSTISQIALRDPSTGSLAAISGSTAIYTLCGLGPSCTITPGTPSAARLLLVRREALELALYTFKYISSVDNFVAILPPGKGVQTSSLSQSPTSQSRSSAAATTTIDDAIVFQRASLKHYLSQPLQATLPENLPPTVDQMDAAPEAELVGVLTGQAFFQDRIVQSQDGSNVLVLAPLPAQ